MWEASDTTLPRLELLRAPPLPTLFHYPVLPTHSLCYISLHPFPSMACLPFFSPISSIVSGLASCAYDWGHIWVACMCLNTTLPPIDIITAIIFSSLKEILSTIPLSDAKSSRKKDAIKNVTTAPWKLKNLSWRIWGVLRESLFDIL